MRLIHDQSISHLHGGEAHVSRIQTAYRCVAHLPMHTRACGRKRLFMPRTRVRAEVHAQGQVITLFSLSLTEDTTSHKMGKKGGSLPHALLAKPSTPPAAPSAGRNVITKYLCHKFSGFFGSSSRGLQSFSILNKRCILK